MAEPGNCDSIKDRIRREVMDHVKRHALRPEVSLLFRTASLSNRFEERLFTILKLGGRDLVQCKAEIARQRYGGDLPSGEIDEISYLTFSWLKELWLGAGAFLSADLVASMGRDPRDSILLQLENAVHDEARAAAGILFNPEQARELPARTDRTVAEESRSAAFPAQAGNTLDSGGYSIRGKGAMDKPSTPNPADLGLLVPGTEEDKQVKKALEASREAEEADPELRRRRQERDAYLTARLERIRGKNPAERSGELDKLDRQEELLCDARAYAEIIYLREPHSPEGRRKVTQRLWDEFIPKHKDKDAFSLGFRDLHSAIWPEGYPSLEGSADQAGVNESVDTGARPVLSGTEGGGETDSAKLREKRQKRGPKTEPSSPIAAGSGYARPGEHPAVCIGESIVPWHMRLRAARDKAKLSRTGTVQKLRAKDIQITADAIKKHEEGVAMPRPDVRKAYALIYELTEDQLFPPDK